MTKYLTLKVAKNDKLNHNTFRITAVASDSTPKIPQLITSSFVFLYTNKDNVYAPYTPIYSDSQKMVFAIKSYPKGRVSSFLVELTPGDTLMSSQPIQKLIYDSGKYKDILMIAGGTGITPMIQIFEKTLSDKLLNNRIPRFTLFFCNLSNDDIFLKDELNKYKDFVKIIHVLEKTKNNKSENTKSGRIGTEMLQQECVLEGELLFDFCYVCGPPGMMKDVCGPKNLDKSQGELSGMLKEIGFTENTVFKF